MPAERLNRLEAGRPSLENGALRLRPVRADEIEDARKRYAEACARFGFDSCFPTFCREVRGWSWDDLFGWMAEPSRTASPISPDGRRMYTLTRSAQPDSPGRERPERSRGAGRVLRQSAPAPGGFLPGSALHVRQQFPPSWFTPAGVAKKRRLLEAKGLPSFKGWRFITLTLARDNFGGCPLTGFLEGREKLRRFMESARRLGLWKRGVKWAWKLEFQRDGWAHWHLLIDRKAKFSIAEMETVDRIWGLGRTNCRRISKSEFGYQFKYAFKGVYQDDGSGLAVPQWFLSYYEASSKGKRPLAFSRCRFWQTSKDFYTGARAKVDERKAKNSSLVPRPLSEVLEDQGRSVVICARDHSGRYVEGKTLRLAVDFKDFLRLFLWDVENRAGVVLSVRSFVVAPDTLDRTINQHEKWQLQPLHQRNRLTLRTANRIRHERRNLETC
ncbi:hypothetical protein HNR46_000092 [Haloferula luteola]|uniref:Replication-associated protein ORF2/G2P domain-containing protein n=1 Tax=Haloferula luteola TaxID=595692 RepID=A0A840VAD3_9BACT|nr:hypothetical protein [Haloferula luteola]MBB5349871.1 hypothetical protein [Haloferula luteola]